MSHFRGLLVALMILGLVGCQAEPRALTVADYRPKTPPMEKKAPDSEVFVLLRWYPIAPVVTTAATQPAAGVIRQHPVEVEQVYAPRNSPIGFRRSDGQLIAIAGTTTKPLEDAHYTWKTLPNSSQRSQNGARYADSFGSSVVEILAVIVVFPIYVWQSELEDDDFDPSDYGTSGGNAHHSGRRAEPHPHAAPHSHPSPKPKTPTSQQ